eukprot:CAMPEP_0185719036 /NCGR_PEP_ID=MMETSP1164-20130828/47953_1 /TAXON_ID=1104430 /ORGANISM="Chrysoreinhardia sp, Strain CCMP2950" /LENGTH=144 /DNA_ID=CAMNT_0028386687 /DNA_START=232 /DNA_END=664 /DNA_ORIENTATION=+
MLVKKKKQQQEDRLVDAVEEGADGVEGAPDGGAVVDGVVEEALEQERAVRLDEAHEVDGAGVARPLAHRGLVDAELGRLEAAPRGDLEAVAVVPVELRRDGARAVRLVGDRVRDGGEPEAVEDRRVDARDGRRDGVVVAGGVVV